MHIIKKAQIFSLAAGGSDPPPPVHAPLFTT